jgi:hypothetical protein
MVSKKDEFVENMSMYIEKKEKLRDKCLREIPKRITGGICAAGLMISSYFFLFNAYAPKLENFPTPPSGFSSTQGKVTALGDILRTYSNLSESNNDRELPLEDNTEKLENKVKNEFDTAKKSLKKVKKSYPYMKYLLEFEKVKTKHNLWKYGGMLTIPLSFIFGALTYGLLGRKRREEMERLEEEYGGFIKDIKINSKNK